MKRDPVFENYSYAQQANSIKMVIIWLVAAVAAHVRKGYEQRKLGVSSYPKKVAAMLRWAAQKIEEMEASPPDAPIQTKLQRGESSNRVLSN